MHVSIHKYEYIGRVFFPSNSFGAEKIKVKHQKLRSLRLDDQNVIIVFRVQYSATHLFMCLEVLTEKSTNTRGKHLQVLILRNNSSATDQQTPQREPGHPEPSHFKHRDRGRVLGIFHIAFIPDSSETNSCYKCLPPHPSAPP